MCKEKDEILNQLQELHANGGETSEQMQVELEASEKVRGHSFQIYYIVL